MSQVIVPDGMKIGASGFYIFCPPNPINPNLDTGATPGDLLTMTSVTGQDSVSLGSFYINTTSGQVWIKTGAISVSAPSGTWTQLNVP
jgi:hypothetical protein